jgi:hypothetical protein
MSALASKQASGRLRNTRRLHASPVVSIASRSCASARPPPHGSCLRRFMGSLSRSGWHGNGLHLAGGPTSCDLFCSALGGSWPMSSLAAVQHHTCYCGKSGHAVRPRLIGTLGPAGAIRRSMRRGRGPPLRIPAPGGTWVPGDGRPRMAIRPHEPGRPGGGPPLYRSSVGARRSMQHGPTKRHTATGKQSQVLVAAVNRHMRATPASGNRLRIEGCVLRHGVDLGIAIDFGGLLDAASQAKPVQLLGAIIPGLAMFLVERVSCASKWLSVGCPRQVWRACFCKKQFRVPPPPGVLGPLHPGAAATRSRCCW